MQLGCGFGFKNPGMFGKRKSFSGRGREGCPAKKKSFGDWAVRPTCRRFLARRSSASMGATAGLGVPQWAAGRGRGPAVGVCHKDPCHSFFLGRGLWQLTSDGRAANPRHSSRFCVPRPSWRPRTRTTRTRAHALAAPFPSLPSPGGRRAPSTSILELGSSLRSFRVGKGRSDGKVAARLQRWCLFHRALPVLCSCGDVGHLFMPAL